MEKILTKLREHKSVTISTVSIDNKPKSRIIDIMKVTDSKIYFITAIGKEFYGELKNNINISISCYTSDYQMIRLNGEALETKDVSINEIFLDNPMLKNLYPRDTRNILRIFKIENGYGEVFDLADIPLIRENFTFGGSKEHFKNYYINDECIECESCLKVCPEDCIEKGTPYIIKQENCVKCGGCSEVCPVDVISFN